MQNSAQAKGPLEDLEMSDTKTEAEPSSIRLCSAGTGSGLGSQKVLRNTFMSQAAVLTASRGTKLGRE